AKSLNSAVGADQRRRLFIYNGGFFKDRRIRHILSLAGYDLKLGLPRESDAVGIWGHSPTAHRGEAIAEKHSAPIIRIEDSFLRSVLPGRSGSPPLGLTIDSKGMHYDPAQISDLEEILTHDPLDNTNLMNRARTCIARLHEAHLTKYTGFDPTTPCPDPGYVLLLDQTLNDASVVKSGADRSTFLEMLVFAQEEHPGKRVLIKTHPDTLAGHRQGYFKPTDVNQNVRFFAASVSPWTLLEGAAAVYTVSSQLGFEAIFAGHKPRVFGQPFYIGWGLTQDERPVQRRQRQLSRAQLFAGAMILYPKWYDPYRNCLCDLETAIDTLEAHSRAWREDHTGWVANGIRLWKRKPFHQIFGQTHALRYEDDQSKLAATMHEGRRHMVWASAKDAQVSNQTVRVEDGFIRSNGLGAQLIAPLSLVLDDLGIYYDPTRTSRLEELIRMRRLLRPDQKIRAERMLDALKQAGLSKYNVGKAALDSLPTGHRILVPGQVENDASILSGTKTISTNLELLRAARNAHPDAILLYKPHPDVEAGLRVGKIEQAELDTLCNVVLNNVDPITAINAVDEVWTMTSLLGFEALVRGKSVTCHGAPFYAGWDLTTDLGAVPARRSTQVSLKALVHATLIDYPRYFDPITKAACPPEVVIERLASGTLPNASPFNRALSKLQGFFAGHAHLWRR
ncbi:capsular polysaccharide biosynthesis protein, partial [Planktotalea sp.]|uniref:capsular polysaccharide biosynthesis protein n=1 Tax=Planktotalea sp. TaxID=2029877 RepID=UPI0025CF568D